MANWTMLFFGKQRPGPKPSTYSTSWHLYPSLPMVPLPNPGHPPCQRQNIVFSTYSRRGVYPSALSPSSPGAGVVLGAVWASSSASASGSLSFSPLLPLRPPRDTGELRPPEGSSVPEFPLFPVSPTGQNMRRQEAFNWIYYKSPYLVFLLTFINHISLHTTNLHILYFFLHSSIISDHICLCIYKWS